MLTDAKIEACITDVKAGLCCPRVHGCEQNDGPYCLVRLAFARAGLIPDPCDEDIAGLTAAEQRTQASRCGCRGADDYCPCQNVPDRMTLAARGATTSAPDAAALVEGE